MTNLKILFRIPFTIYFLAIRTDLNVFQLARKVWYDGKYIFRGI